MKNIIIAIDGHSSTGKSTLAKQLAKYLGYVYVDTGAMYRAITLFAMKNNWISSAFCDKEKIIAHLKKVRLMFKFNKELGFAEIYLNGKNVENEIRTLQVSNNVSKVAEISEVRTKLVEQQQNMGKKKGIVMDGRDIGTVVFPNAELKLFMTASAEIRAKRRFKELVDKKQKVTYEDVLQNVIQRDFIDSNREDSPLLQAKDAVVIDNSELSKEEQFALVLKLIKTSS